MDNFNPTNAADLLATDSDLLPDIIIYALIDPRDNQVRYIGQTKDLIQRFEQHLSNPPSGPMAMWMIELCNNDILPILRVLDSAIKRDAWKVESDWIKRAKQQGHKLFNRNCGGIRLTFDELVRKTYPVVPNTEKFARLECEPCRC